MFTRWQAVNMLMVDITDDVGYGVFDDSTAMAKDALVFMAVCVNGPWKIP